MQTHLGNYVYAADIAVGEHFQSPGHTVSDLVFTPVEQIFTSNIFVRKVREKKLINRCDLLRRGLNKNLWVVTFQKSNDCLKIFQHLCNISSSVLMMTEYMSKYIDKEHYKWAHFLSLEEAYSVEEIKIKKKMINLTK